MLLEREPLNTLKNKKKNGLRLAIDVLCFMTRGSVSMDNGYGSESVVFKMN